MQKIASSFNVTEELKVDHDARIKEQLKTDDVDTYKGTSSGYTRNKWGALKTNLSDVVLAEKRKSIRDGVAVMVDENGKVTTAKEEEARASGVGGREGVGSSGGEGASLAEVIRQKTRGSFSESRFAINAKHRKAKSSMNVAK